ncbi:Hint domain-containing protein [Yoonia sp.]|uniref:Hint domain-containing protein n=1 Tax=Yoonia sp. TaxID=2212373 RepID=UPI0025E0F0E3|nr:Hint domain-containing protein [Yoonia sp.]
MPFLFDWTTFSSPDGTTTIFDGADNTSFTSTAFSTAGANDPRYFGNFGGVLFSQNVPAGQGSGVQLDFGNSVDNLTFEILDLDANAGAWDDQVTITALDADGNPVIPVFTNLTTNHVQTSPNTVEANGATSNAVDGPGAADSITVTFNAPVVSVVITISGGSSGIRTGAVGISNISGDIVCFARDTMIQTNRGDIPVQDLHLGDLVQTLDHGLQPIRWIGSRTVDAIGKFAPVSIAAGVLDNTRTLVLSPQHRVLLQGWQAELLFGESEVLVAAKHLVDDSRVVRREGGSVTYFHILFDRHEIVFAEGAACESFHPGHVDISGMEDAQRNELFALFPEMQNDVTQFGPLARVGLKAAEGGVLAQMMLRPN